MAHSPGVARTIIMFPTSISHPRWLELPLARLIFHGPKPVQAIEVLLYIQLQQNKWLQYFTKNILERKMPQQYIMENPKFYLIH